MREIVWWRREKFFYQKAEEATTVVNLIPASTQVFLLINNFPIEDDNHDGDANEDNDYNYIRFQGSALL